MADDFTNSGVGSSGSILPPSSPDDETINDSIVPDSTVTGETDSIQSTGPQVQLLVFNFNSPVLDIPLNIYAQILSTSRLESDRQNRSEDVSNPGNTKPYYNEIVERCKLNRKQRKRLDNFFEGYNAIVNKINDEVNAFNPKITAYNNQVTDDNSQIATLNAAIAQYNIDGIEANLTTAVNNYNAYLATVNPNNAQYDGDATDFNAEVDDNNEEIARLNAKGAKFAPPLPSIPAENYAGIAGQIASFPPPPYTAPVGTVASRTTIPLLTTYADPPDKSGYTDPTLPGDQSIQLKSLIQSRQLLEKQDANLEVVNFKLRGLNPTLANAYVREEPDPQSGGGNSSMTGIGSSLFGDKSPMLENYLSLSTFKAALSEYDKGPIRSESVEFSQEQGKVQQNLTNDLAKSAIDLLFSAAKQAGVAAALKYENDLNKFEKTGGVDISKVLIAAELVKIAKNFAGKDGQDILQSIAEELVAGSGLQNLAPEDQQALTLDIKALLQNVLTLFSLSNLGNALKTPGLVPQVLGNAAPQYAQALQPPTDIENFNSLLADKGIQLQQVKNAIIDSLLLTGQLPRRETVKVVDKSVDQVAAQGPFDSFQAFVDALKKALTKAPTEEAPSVEQPVEPVLPPIDDTALTDALKKSFVQINNLLPLSTVKASDLDRPIPYGFIDRDFANTAAAQRVVQNTNISSDTLSRILDNAISTSSLNTARDFRDSVLQIALRTTNDLDQSLLVSNRVAAEVVDSRIATNNFAVSRLDADNLQSALTSAIIKQGVVQDQQQAADIAQQTVKDATETSQRIASENDLRNFLKRDLVSRYNLQVEAAARIATDANFKVPKPDTVQLSNLGAESVLPRPRLSETLNDYISKELNRALPPERSREVASEIVLNVVGRPATPNLDVLDQLGDPGSLLRITQDTVKHFDNVQNENVSVTLAKEFRERIKTSVDVYALSLEIMDPANIYVRSKLEGISYTRDEPSFRKSIDIII